MIDDDANVIRDKMLVADVIVWATPVYYYSCSGQMKTMIDLANPMYNSDYQFREVYLLASAAEDEDTTVTGTVKATQGWVDCFEKAALKGVVFAGGVDNKDAETVNSVAHPDGNTKRMSLKIRNDGATVKHYYSYDGKNWITPGWNDYVVDYHHNNLGQFQSLVPGLYVFGDGKARFSDLKYTRLR